MASLTQSAMEISRPLRARFGVFELDLKAGELHKSGGAVLLQEQPFRILLMLVERRGEVATREEIRRKLWPNDTVVEFDHAINTAIKKLRHALGDSAQSPKYIETVGHRGYRLMIPVEWAEGLPGSAVDSHNQHTLPAQPESGPEAMTGKRVSHYRVLEIVGGGGMGVVYAAEDIKLGRRVALKFLPVELGEDPRFLKRFEQEARAASALNHPNICTIYEFGEHDGQPFIAMELLEGRTLRERIAEAGPIPIELVCDLAIQIAEGLDAAHQKHIIHSDIKPANIFITNRSQAKLLDFGLAGVGRVEPLETSTAANPNFTRTGFAMGTAAYMSPEQVRGEKLDQRTDLFSFGLVLYEAATGRQAFSGETAAVLRDAILNGVPVPARELNPQLPFRLEQIINRALQKDRALRYQTASEIRADLTAIAAGLRRSGDSAGGRWQVKASRHVAAGGVIAALIAAGGALWFMLHRPAIAPAELIERQLTFNSSANAIESAAISRDGKYLAYSDPGGIRVRLLSIGQEWSIPVPAALGVDALRYVDSWFPDGTRLLVHSEEAGGHQSMWAISAMGQSSRKLSDDASGWEVSPDGAHIAFSPGRAPNDAREIWMMDSQGDNPQKVLGLAAEESLRFVHWSPDGQRLVYIRVRPTEQLTETCDLKGANRRAVMVAPYWGPFVRGLCWLPDRRIVYSQGETLDIDANLWQIGVDTPTGMPISKPKRITRWFGSNLRGLSASGDGTRLVLQKETNRGQIYIGALAAGSTHMSSPVPLTQDEAINSATAWTADSKAVLFYSNRNGNWGIYKQDIGGEAAVPLVEGRERVDLPRLDPDGAWVIYRETLLVSGHAPRGRLMRVPVNGGTAELVFETEGGEDHRCARAPASVCVIFKEDEERLTVRAFDPLKGKGKLLRTIDKKSGEWFGSALSPDGSTIAVARKGEPDIHIRFLSLISGSESELVVKGWPNLAGLDWSADGKGLYVGSRSSNSSSLLYVSLKGTVQRVWQTKEAVNFLGGIPSPDGHYLAIWGPTRNSTAWMVEGF